MRASTATMIIILALAGSRPAVAAVDAPFISGSHYEQNGNIECFDEAGSSGPAPVDICRLVFTAPPPNKRIALKRVSCSL